MRYSEDHASISQGAEFHSIGMSGVFGLKIRAFSEVSKALWAKVSNSGLAALMVCRVERMLRIYSFTLSARTECVREARRYVVATLGPDHPCLYAATEAASELVTNAILYGSRDEQAKVNLRMRLLGRRRVRLTVSDEGGTRHVPVIGRPDGDAVHGRGLLIVSALSSHLDWARQGPGHKVEALLDPLLPGPDLARSAASVDLDAYQLEESAGDLMRGKA